jgi:hypothetical protein
MSNPLGEITRSLSIRDGLDDGPELPSQAARDRASAKIDAQRLITDAERINWLEKTKYLEIGIGYHDHHPAMQIRFREHGNLKNFSGRSLRAAIDEAIRAEGK